VTLPQRSSLLRRLLFAAVVVGAASTVALLAAEFAVRLLALASPPVAVTADERTFAQLPGVFFPSRTRIDRRIPGIPHRVTINDLGFRGPQVPLEKPIGERRVVIIGDSFAWGDYVDDDLTVPAQLERLLQSTCPSTRVLNFGVGGTTIDGQLVMFERAKALSPDVVILMHHDNDVLDMRTPTYWTLVAENRVRKSTFPASLMYGFVRNTALWSLARQTQVRLQARRRSSADPEESSAGPAPDLDLLKNRYRQGLLEFAERVHEAGLPLLVTAYPSHLALRNPDETPFAWFEDLARAESLPFVSARDALLASGEPVGGLYLLPLDGHASGRGYQIVADALARALLDLKIISCDTY